MRATGIPVVQITRNFIEKKWQGKETAGKRRLKLLRRAGQDDCVLRCHADPLPILDENVGPGHEHYGKTGQKRARSWCSQPCEHCRDPCEQAVEAANAELAYFGLRTKENRPQSHFALPVDFSSVNVETRRVRAHGVDGKRGSGVQKVGVDLNACSQLLQPGTSQE